MSSGQLSGQKSVHDAEWGRAYHPPSLKKLLFLEQAVPL